MLYYFPGWSIYLYLFIIYVVYYNKLTCSPPPPSFSAPSLRLAYKDLEQHRKIEEQKLKGLDGKKKEQAERLGMGLGVRRYDEEEAETACLENLCFHFCDVFCFSLVLLQRRVSLRHLRHAHHPTGEPLQELQGETVCWG